MWIIEGGKGLPGRAQKKKKTRFSNGKTGLYAISPWFPPERLKPIIVKT
jgi:hypothetical protein